MSISISDRSLKSSLDDITIDKKKVDEASKFREDSTESKVKRQKQEFFTLLAVQLKNQDPTAPMDTNQMSQQVFAINQVEQQLETNKHLNDIKSHFMKSQVNSAVSYIDKMAFYEGNQFQLNDAKVGLIKYSLSEDATSAMLVIRDKSGTEVFKDNIPSEIGEHMYKWKAPEELQNGVYSYEIKAIDADDHDIISKKFGYGIIKSILTRDGENTLEINGKEIPQNDIFKFTTEEALIKEMKL